MSLAVILFHGPSGFGRMRCASSLVFLHPFSTIYRLTSSRPTASIVKFVPVLSLTTIIKWMQSRSVRGTPPWSSLSTPEPPTLSSFLKMTVSSSRILPSRALWKAAIMMGILMTDAAVKGDSALYSKEPLPLRSSMATAHSPPAGSRIFRSSSSRPSKRPNARALSEPHVQVPVPLHEQELSPVCGLCVSAIVLPPFRGFLREPPVLPRGSG